MKRIITLLIVVLVAQLMFAQSDKTFNYHKEIEVEVTNNADIAYKDAMVKLNLNELKDFNKNAFIITLNDKEIASQLYNDGFDCYALFVSDFNANETKTFKLVYLEEGTMVKDYESRTYAEIAMKFDAKYANKKFNADHFKNFTKVVVPKIHTDHDALFKYEGPGWESELVGYRTYLDWRNSTDIFAKTKYALVLDDVGTNDVIAKDDSYHNMQDWGMDVFKVGKSLGIGSVGMMADGKIEKVSKTDLVTCEIASNGPLLSEVITNYKAWEIAGNKFDLVMKNSIEAGSRCTNTEVYVYDNADNITSGLAKHKDTDFFKSENDGDWQYIALYGKQTVVDDNLGIAFFYKKDALLEQGEDELNYFVKLKPELSKVEYKYMAVWEQEPEAAKSLDEFKAMLNDLQVQMNNPLSVQVK